MVVVDRAVLVLVDGRGGKGRGMRRPNMSGQAKRAALPSFLPRGREMCTGTWHLAVCAGAQQRKSEDGGRF